MLFISAWNEWPEGKILEHDKEFKFNFLETIKEVLTKKK